jgi:hypothetical protein
VGLWVSEVGVVTDIAVFRPSSERGSGHPRHVIAPNGIILIVSAEFDRLIHEKRSQLRGAFAAYQKAREVLAHAQMQFAGFVRADEPDSTHVAPEVLRDSQAEIGRLESEVRDAATHFNAVSDELAQLHRGKYGEWHLTWRGPLPSR